MPEIYRFKDFALHGGTAINLFHHNIPRLSVDIDLTYITFHSRVEDLNQIRLFLENLAKQLVRTIPEIQTKIPAKNGDDFKLICTLKTAMVKVEVNTINRGILSTPEVHILSQEATELFEMFFEMQLVPTSQLFGGKIVAALDRQHPRDLFDTKQLLDRSGLTDEVMIGFIFCLLSSKRPIHEILDPAPIDQKAALENQFKGMTRMPFTYEMYESERERLINAILRNLNNDHKLLLESFSEGQPIWINDDWSKFPGIAWKLKNIRILKSKNQEKFNQQSKKLKAIL